MEAAAVLARLSLEQERRADEVGAKDVPSEP